MDENSIEDGDGKVKRLIDYMGSMDIKRTKKKDTKGGRSYASSSPNTGRTSGRRLSSRMNPDETNDDPR